MIKFLIGVAVSAALFATPAFAQGDAATSREGILKVCKVGGPGVPLGTRFTFTTTPGWTFQVPAGSGPGGNCWIGGFYPVTTHVTITEAPLPGYSVSSITAVPGLNSSNPATGTATVTIGPGVTEVTYTNKATGYLEICKFTNVAGNYTFSVNQGAQTTVVPAMSCSPAIQVTAGSVAISETVPNSGMSQCFQWHGTWTQCPVNGQSTTVTVNAGDVTNQTLVLIVNNIDQGGDRNSRAAPPPPSDEMQRILKSMGSPPLTP